MLASRVWFNKVMLEVQRRKLWTARWRLMVLYVRYALSPWEA